MNRLYLLLLIPVAAGGVWLYQKKTDPPVVPFAKAARMTISNTLSTNGKVEPVEYADARSEVSGLAKRILVHLGDTVRAGQTLAELSQPGLEEELRGAEARASQARGELGTLRAGGRSSDFAEIDGNISRLKVQLANAQRNLEAVDRLVKQQAATKFESEQIQHTIADLETQVKSLQQRRASLVSKGEVESAEAKVAEADAAIELSRRRITLAKVVSPLAGIVYSLPARAGAYLSAGDPVASIGKLNPARVRVYVDEPELGRVATGEPVRITWDALPGKEWKGTVEKLPSEIIALGSRQVGEVLCTIDNPANELAPGTNVNAFVLTQVVQNALTIPKTALRRESGTGVFLLKKDGSIQWQPVKTGVSDAFRIEITSGLSEGDSVALPNDQILKDGLKVNPSVP